MALDYYHPLWTLIIAVLFLKEVVTIKKIIAVLFGMADILVILKPGIEIIEYFLIWNNGYGLGVVAIVALIAHHCITNSMKL